MVLSTGKAGSEVVPRKRKLSSEKPCKNCRTVPCRNGEDEAKKGDLWVGMVVTASILENDLNLSTDSSVLDDENDDDYRKQEHITFHRGGTFLSFGNRSFDLLDLYALSGFIYLFIEKLGPGTKSKV